jgi:glycosyltransferase involved in cell wall biosynthesis
MDRIDDLVSVVLPFANAEQFLRDAIDSVVSQTFSKWELILVDDGSTDRSREIALGYVRHAPTNIRYVTHDGNRNRGVTRSRNLGAENSEGAYLAFLDADDVWLPEKLEVQVALMEGNREAGMVYGPSEYWFSWRGEKTDRVPPVAPGEKLYTPPFLLLHSHPLGRYGAPCPSSFLIRREAFNKVGGFPEEFRPDTYQLYEDSAFLSKVYLNSPVFVTRHTTEKYRCHPDSIWFRTQGKTSEETERRYFFCWLRAYLRAIGVKDSAIWRAVRREAWMYWLPLPNFVTRILRRGANRLRRRAVPSE